MRKLSLLFFFVCISWVCVAQPMRQMIQVSVVPDSETWLYPLGKDACFTITVTKDGILQKGVEVRYELSRDMMEPEKWQNYGRCRFFAYSRLFTLSCVCGGRGKNV